MQKLLNEIDTLARRFLPQNKAAEGGPGSGRHATGRTASDSDVRERALQSSLNKYIGNASDGEDDFSDEYIAINSNLRSGGEADETVRGLDGGMKEMPSDIKELYRGVPRLPCVMEVGATFEDKAFCSTSPDRAVAARFGAKSLVVIKIENPSSAKSIDLRERNREEKEVLLQRGCKFKITGIESKSTTGREIHEVTVQIIK